MYPFVKHSIFTLVAILFIQVSCIGQTQSASTNRATQSKNKLKSVEQLISKEESSWNLVMQWKQEANNKVEILPKDSKRAENALYQTQVTTRTPMGAIIYESGGIL